MGKIDLDYLSWGELKTIRWDDSISITGYAYYEIDKKRYPILIFTHMPIDDFDNKKKRVETLTKDAIAGIHRRLKALEAVKEQHNG